jgi:endonuclease YncB( thermonuclease family)
LSLDASTGAPVAKVAPVDIPKGIKWEQPVNAVTAVKGAIPKGEGTKTVVSYVADGDTFSGKSGINCRIDTIDAPEKAKPQYNKPGQPYGEEARKKLEELVLNKEVNIRVVKPADKYGRSICQVEIEGKGVDHLMVQAGAAWVYEHFAKDTLRGDGLNQEQDAARKAKRGLWKDPNPTYPPNFRGSQ